MTNSQPSRTRRFFDGLFIRLSRNTKFDGLWIGVFSEDRDNELPRRVSEALQLIKTYDPYRYRRVLREIDRILVCLLPDNAAAFVPELRRCLVDPRYIRSCSPEFLASAIVHEATHGALIRRNIGYSEELRHRVEKVCMRQELAFARKIPHGQELRQTIERSLERAPEFWADEVVSKRTRKGEVEMARYAGIPNWLVTALLNFRDLTARGRR
jgi:hypothetical protein